MLELARHRCGLPYLPKGERVPGLRRRMRRPTRFGCVNEEVSCAGPQDIRPANYTCARALYQYGASVGARLRGGDTMYAASVDSSTRISPTLITAPWGAFGPLTRSRVT